jgi:hypothetical protein
MANPNRNDQHDGKQSSFNDQADGTGNREKLAPGVTSDDGENAGQTYSKNLMGRAESQVRENEDASLQDDTYAFDEDNTDNEDFHDVDDDYAGDADFDATDDFA